MDQVLEMLLAHRSEPRLRPSRSLRPRSRSRASRGASLEERRGGDGSRWRLAGGGGSGEGERCFGAITNATLCMLHCFVSLTMLALCGVRRGTNPAPIQQLRRGSRAVRKVQKSAYVMTLPSSWPPCMLFFASSASAASSYSTYANPRDSPTCSA